MVVVLGIIGIAMALAAPNLSQWSSDQRAKAAARSIADVFGFARSEAIRSSSNVIVFFAAGGGTDPIGTALTDGAGNPVPILVINDGVPGSALQNCRIDPGEGARVVRAERDVNWGVSFAASPAPGDAAGAIPGNGLTLRRPTGGASTWVLFRPDGVPVAFDAACALGQVGSGSGAVYITNANRDYAAVLSPLGGVRVEAWDPTQGVWR